MPAAVAVAGDERRPRVREQVGDRRLRAGVDDGALVLGRQERASQFLVPFDASPRWSGRTTNVGRFSFMLPRP